MNKDDRASKTVNVPIMRATCNPARLSDADGRGPPNEGEISSDARSPRPPRVGRNVRKVARESAAALIQYRCARPIEATAQD